MTIFPAQLALSSKIKDFCPLSQIPLPNTMLLRPFPLPLYPPSFYPPAIPVSLSSPKPDSVSQAATTPGTSPAAVEKAKAPLCTPTATSIPVPGRAARSTAAGSTCSQARNTSTRATGRAGKCSRALGYWRKTAASSRASSCTTRRWGRGNSRGGDMR